MTYNGIFGPPWYLDPGPKFFEIIIRALATTLEVVQLVYIVAINS